jgi:hypothetical protein
MGEELLIVNFCLSMERHMLASAGLSGVASRPLEAKARKYRAACAAPRWTTHLSVFQLPLGVVPFPELPSRIVRRDLRGGEGRDLRG